MHVDKTRRQYAAMGVQLQESLEAGALGLSTGLAYASAFLSLIHI
ncbi:hypothetical protein QN401_28795 [Pseudomonas sp. 5S3]|nr:hypothetical protein [Pseudomonas sp. 5S3]MEB0239060.1 hypothetical protein [Pseudomonas sp. 5S3]